VLEIIAPGSSHHSVDIHALGSQICPGLIDLLHQFGVSGGHIVESEDAVAELKQEISAEGDESPEGELWRIESAWFL
jgi:hypothetical protein